MCPEDTETRDKHPAVADEGGSKVCGKTVLADARVRARGEEIILQPRLHHPPSDEALETDESRNAEQVDCHPRGYPTAGDEVDGRDHKREANDATPDAVCPFHKVDLLKLGQVHMRVDNLEFRGSAVLVELGLPVGVGHGRQRAGDGPPFGDAQTVHRSVSDLKKAQPVQQTYPDSVNRVKPPKMTMPKTLTALPISQ